MSKMTKTKNVPVVSLGTRYIQVHIARYTKKHCAISRLCNVLRNLEIVQCPYAISRLVRNFRIPRMRSANPIAQIPKLHGTYILADMYI